LGTLEIVKAKKFDIFFKMDFFFTSCGFF